MPATSGTRPAQRLVRAQPIAVVHRATDRAVCTAFAEAQTKYGVPEEMLTDNGTQFTDRFGPGRGGAVEGVGLRRNRSSPAVHMRIAKRASLGVMIGVPLVRRSPTGRWTMSPNLVQRLSAEALGTLLLVFFGAAATLAATAGALGTALAYTVALTLAVWVFGAASGAHVNPAVTIALAVRGRFAWLDVPGYLLAQV